MQNKLIRIYNLFLMKRAAQSDFVFVYFFFLNVRAIEILTLGCQVFRTNVKVRYKFINPQYFLNKQQLNLFLQSRFVRAQNIKLFGCLILINDIKVQDKLMNLRCFKLSLDYLTFATISITQNKLTFSKISLAI